MGGTCWAAPALLCSTLNTCSAGGSFVSAELLVATCLKCHKCQSLLHSDRYLGRTERGGEGEMEGERWREKERGGRGGGGGDSLAHAVLKVNASANEEKLGKLPGMVMFQ